MNGETEIKNDNTEFSLYFVISNENSVKDNKKFKVEKCKKEDFFFDIIDKLCQTETNLDKEKIKKDEFSIKGRNNGEEYIDYNDTLEGNKIEGNEEIIIRFKNEDNEIQKNK